MTKGESDPHTHKSDLSDTEKGKSLPSGRPGKEEDMAAATLYLASYAGVWSVLSSLSWMEWQLIRRVNGQAIIPDGGATVASNSSI